MKISKEVKWKIRGHGKLSKLGHLADIKFEEVLHAPLPIRHCEVIQHRDSDCKPIRNHSGYVAVVPGPL